MVTTLSRRGCSTLQPFSTQRGMPQVRQIFDICNVRVVDQITASLLRAARKYAA